MHDVNKPNGATLDDPPSALEEGVVAPFCVDEPARLSTPLIFVSPHSGEHYPAAFIAQSRLDALALRGSEDAFVDELFAAAPRFGAPLLCANYPRAYLDVNREPWELDPEMFEGELPSYVNASSYRVTGGLGTLARVVSNGAEIYAGKLRFEEAERRVKSIYTPFHDCLKRLIADAREAFGCAVVVDCHSMPSVGGPMDKDTGRRRADVILGDRFGSSCADTVIDTAEQAFRGLTYSVARNTPYAGGFTTRNYGRPGAGVHTLQIELNRGLYMDEQAMERLAEFDGVAGDMTSVIDALTGLDPATLTRGR